VLLDQEGWEDKMGASPESRALEHRRRSLGMSQAELARRSDLSMQTVRRILTQGMESVAAGKVRAVARALGMQLQYEAMSTVREMQEQEARKKAQAIVRMLQGTSGLESQALDEETCNDLIEQTVHELMAGPKRKLWAQM
jgi:transcriptional regulator with XRE-family HTH domain